MSKFVIKRAGRHVAVAAAVLLSGCTTSTTSTPMFSDPPPEAEVNIAPTNYKAEILADLRAQLVDYKGVRDAAITPPAIRFMGAANRYSACLQFNAKNALGGYTGTKTYVAVFLRGHLSTVSSDVGAVCSTATGYEPFPELERL